MITVIFSDFKCYFSSRSTIFYKLAKQLIDIEYSFIICQVAAFLAGT